MTHTHTTAETIETLTGVELADWHRTWIEALTAHPDRRVVVVPTRRGPQVVLVPR